MARRSRPIRAARRSAKAQLAHAPAEVSGDVERARKLLTPAFFAARRGAGCPSPDPIFIVGLPRSGSTLVEQILASHSPVEGTMELPNMLTVANGLDRRGADGARGALPGGDRRASGGRARRARRAYLADTRAHRSTERRGSSTSCRTTGCTSA